MLIAVLPRPRVNSNQWSHVLSDYRDETTEPESPVPFYSKLPQRAVCGVLVHALRATRLNVMHLEKAENCNLRDLFSTYRLVARAHVVRHKHMENQPAMGLWRWHPASRPSKPSSHWKERSTMAIAYGSMSLPIYQLITNQPNPFDKEPSSAAPIVVGDDTLRMGAREPSGNRMMRLF
jgi:hypothetical protein